MVLENFAYLPEVLIHKIINYTDVLSYRNGKYIDRINKKDNRYNLLQKGFTSELLELWFSNNFFVGFSSVELYMFSNLSIKIPLKLYHFDICLDWNWGYCNNLHCSRTRRRLITE